MLKRVRDIQNNVEASVKYMQELEKAKEYVDHKKQQMKLKS
ncbi:MAG: hypothetical protein Q4D45_07615 [Lachnospiraceae bacterium]|nr:hypothetical protein [Lachnospiraceae bacterium]